MRLRPLFLVILSVWTTLLLLASSCQAARTRFDLIRHRRPASYFLEPTSSDSGSENFEYDAQGSNKRAKSVSVRPSSKRQRGREDSDGWFDDAEKANAGKVARKASSSHGDRFEGVGDNYIEVTEEWARFKMVLAYRESGHDSNRDGLWDELKEINKFVDQMLGPPSTMNGDDLSRLNLTNVPFEEVNKAQKNFKDAFKSRIICGWATSDTDFIEGQWQISVVRYVPEGGWRNAYKTSTERQRAAPESSSSSLAASMVKEPKEVKFNFERLGWPSDEQVSPRPSLVTEQ